MDLVFIYFLSLLFLFFIFFFYFIFGFTFLFFILDLDKKCHIMLYVTVKQVTSHDKKVCHMSQSQITQSCDTAKDIEGFRTNVII